MTSTAGPSAKSHTPHISQLREAWLDSVHELLVHYRASRGIPAPDQEWRQRTNDLETAVSRTYAAYLAAIPPSRPNLCDSPLTV